MPRRQRISGIEGAIKAFSVLPWWFSLVLAVLTWVLCHRLAQLDPVPAKDIGQLGVSVKVTMLKTAGMILQYVAPLVLVLAALCSMLAMRRRSKLLVEAEARTGSAPLRNMTWREFEQLVGAYFERLGYSVSFTADGADGGVDVVARMGSETFLIQCKQWRATQVGVGVVRELYGLMAARGATGGYVVSIGPFTSDAEDFADGRNINLVDANSLLSTLNTRSPASTRPAPPRLTTTIPTCPKCGTTMIRRIAKQGANRGRAFYGCTNYPQCRATLPAH